MLKMSDMLQKEYEYEEVWSDEQEDFVEEEILKSYSLTGKIEENGVIVGELLIEVVVSKEEDDENYEKSDAYLARIDVYEEHQGKGYGTKAIYELKDVLKSDRLYCSADNADAARLYARIGNPVTGNDPSWASDFQGKNFKLW